MTEYYEFASDGNGYEVYNEFLAIKQHFTVDNYDYFKYKGKVRGTIDSFKTKRDKYYYVKLYNTFDYKNIILANIVTNPKVWIGELLDENIGLENYRNWKARIDKLSYTLKSELSKLDPDFQKNFKIENGNTPIIVKLFLQRTISLETFSILIDITNTYEYLTKNISDTIVALPAIKKAKKYVPFLSYDKNKIEKMISDYYCI